MTQLAHEQNLHDGQSAKSAAGGCSFSARRCVAEGGATSRRDRCSARSESDIIFLTATMLPPASAQHSTTPAVPLPTNFTGRSSSGRMNACCGANGHSALWDGMVQAIAGAVPGRQTARRPGSASPAGHPFLFGRAHARSTSSDFSMNVGTRFCQQLPLTLVSCRILLILVILERD